MEIFNLADKYLTDVNFIDIQFYINQSNNERCLARIWGNGDYGNEQCIGFINENGLCSKHLNASIRMGGKWWLGLITEERPEMPIHPISGKHKWSKDKNGNDYEIIKEEKEVIKEDVINKPLKQKRPRGRPKGSKNKKN